MNALVGQKAKSNFSLFLIVASECADDGSGEDGGDFAGTGAGGHLRGGGEFEVLHDGSKELQPSWRICPIFSIGWQRREMAGNRRIVTRRWSARIMRGACWVSSNELHSTDEFRVG
jgi:hypothetical protein